MYGLIIEGLRQYIVERFSEAFWTEITIHLQVDWNSFATHDIYSDTVVNRIADAVFELKGVPANDLMEGLGVFMVNLFDHYGYTTLLRAVGRDLRSLLHEMDNVHDYLRTSYKKLKSPSFYIVAEDEHGITLQYRTKRHGFVYYIKGQLPILAKKLYNTNITVDILGSRSEGAINITEYRLLFDNTTYAEHAVSSKLTVTPDLFADAFPFYLVINKELKILECGMAFQLINDKLVGSSFEDIFLIQRPLIHHNWHELVTHTNNVFELLMLGTDTGDELNGVANDTIHEDIRKSSEMFRHTLKLKGAVAYVPQEELLFFVGSPLIASISAMQKLGIYISDLSMHDNSRELLIAGDQNSDELKKLLKSEHEKCEKLASVMDEVKKELRHTEALLYQMLPRTIATQLRNGITALETCKTFEMVTLLQSDVVGFTTICSGLTPFDVVSMLNSMYVEFDKLAENHRVHKVETIGDAYLVSAGVPIPTKFHALYVVSFAFEMVRTVESIKVPNSQATLKIRVGIHSGSCVAGVVGLKMPRYCLFGNTVVIANKMEQTSSPQKIHISETTKLQLEQTLSRFQLFIMEEKDSVNIKGFGNLKTYWLLGKHSLTKEVSLQLQNILDLEWNSQNEELQRQIAGKSRSSVLSVLSDVSERSRSIRYSSSTNSTLTAKPNGMPMQLNASASGFELPQQSTLPAPAVTTSLSNGSSTLEHAQRASTDDRALSRARTASASSISGSITCSNVSSNNLNNVPEEDNLSSAPGRNTDERAVPDKQSKEVLADAAQLSVNNNTNNGINKKTDGQLHAKQRTINVVNTSCLTRVCTLL